MSGIIRRYEVTDAEWERLEPYFPEWQMGDYGDAERNLLDRPKRGGVAGLARAVRAMPNGIQAVPGVVGRQSDREDLSRPPHRYSSCARACLSLRCVSLVVFLRLLLLILMAAI